jgi:hypothetical protein
MSLSLADKMIVLLFWPWQFSLFFGVIWECLLFSAAKLDLIFRVHPPICGKSSDPPAEKVIDEG